jgi:hypothetical protein
VHTHRLTVKLESGDCILQQLFVFGLVRFLRKRRLSLQAAIEKAKKTFRFELRVVLVALCVLFKDGVDEPFGVLVHAANGAFG